MRCNTRFAGALLALSVLMGGCGEEDGFPPLLTDIVSPETLPAQYLYDSDSGAALLEGEVGFEDPDGDVVLLTVTWQDCGNEPLRKLDILQEDLKRTRMGVIPFMVVISTDCPIGVYTVNLLATDGRGYTSNVMAVPYEIIESFE